MKVHCPKCNSVNFLPSTLPSSIISNISCAVCKEMIDVPVAPEYDLPDEELMDVSSLRDKLDDKGRLLNPNAFDSDETADTGSLDSHQLPPLEMDDTILPVYDDMPAPPSNDTFAMIDDETTPLSIPSFDETVGLRQNDFQFHTTDQPESKQAEQSSIFPQPGEFQQPYDFGQTQNYPQTYDFPQNQSYGQPQDFSETEYNQQTQNFPETDYSQQTQALNQSQDLTQSQQTNNDDIWAHLRKETEQMQLSNAPVNPTPQEYAPIILENEPRRKSGGLKFLVFGFLFLLLIGVGAGALWLYIISTGDDTTAKQERPNLQTSSNPPASTSNSNVTPVGANNSNTKPQNNTNSNTKNTNSTNTNTAATQNSNSEQANNANTQPSPNGTRERVVKNTNNGTQNSAGSGSGDGRFTIQVGSYPNAEAANARVSQLQSGGFPARVVVANIPRKGTWYRVQVGRYATRGEADNVVRDMRAKGAAKEFFVTEVQ